MRSRTRRVFRLLCCSSFLVTFAGCPHRPPVAEPGPYPGASAVLATDTIPRGMRSQLVQDIAAETVPGRVRVVLEPRLWKTEFRRTAADTLAEGIERLAVSPELAEVFACYQLLRVWRSMPQLERQVGGSITVISYAEWVRERQGRGELRENARAYEPPDLRDARGTFELEFPEETDLTAAVADLLNVPGVIRAVALVEPASIASFTPIDPGWVAPSDPSYNATLAVGRWGFHNTGSALAAGFLDDFDIDAPEAWDIQRGSPQVVVAVLDNGVDVTHPDIFLNVFLNNAEVPASIVTAHRGASSLDGLPTVLTFYDLNEPAVVTALAAAGCAAGGGGCTDTNGNGLLDGEDAVAWWSDGVDDDPNGFVDDLVGWDFVDGMNRPFEVGEGDHGTPVAGLIAARGGNGTGISGVAPDVRVLPVTSTFDIAEIAYALSFLEVRVINHSMSWRYDGGTPAEVAALFRTLEPEGVLYVGSLGNRNGFYYGGDPSQREDVVSVSNFESDGRRNATGGSGYGPKTDVAAPGSGLYSLTPRTATAPGGTGWFGGTSAASPMTAGVAALVASEAPTLTPEQIRQALRMTATDPASVPDDRSENTPGWDLYSGWGLVNAFAVLSSVSGGTTHPEANILSLFRNYRNTGRNEAFSIQRGTVGLVAYLGLPGGGSVGWTLRRSLDWDMSAAVTVATGTTAYLDGTAPFHSIDTDALVEPRHVLELEVTAGGVVSRERAVIDLPRAYIGNLQPGQWVIEPVPIRGFAYGPGFTRYRILVAPGWTPAATDFVEVHTSTSEQAPALGEPGSSALERELMPSLDIFSLPITVPADGEVTVRVVTEGTSNWSFEERVFVDAVQPPMMSGFPVAHGIYTTLSPPSTANLDGLPGREIIIPGAGSAGIVKVYHADGTEAAGWPVTLPSGELIVQPAAVGDVTGDGRPEVVLRTMPMEGQERIRILRRDGVELTAGWPITFDSPLMTYSRLPAQPNPPVLADVTGDGRLDILVSESRSAPAVPASVVNAYRSDGSLAFSYAASTAELTLTPPVVGDIDGDSEPEIAAVGYSFSLETDPATLYVWERDGTSKWTREIRTNQNNTAQPPVMVDADGDGVLEVVAGAGGGDVRIYRGDGTLLGSAGTSLIATTFSAGQLQPGSSPADRAAVYSYRANVPTDPTQYGSFINAVNAATGARLGAWTADLQIADAQPGFQPLIADFSGGADLEIGFANAPMSILSLRGRDSLFTFALADAAGNPVSDGGLWPLRSSTGLAADPLVSDLDGDGDLELVYLSRLGAEFGKLYVYDLATPSGPGRVGWGEFAHDGRRSGNYHGDLRILSPNTASVPNVGPHDDASAQSLLLVRTTFARGAPTGGTTTTRWSARIGTQAAAIREVAAIQDEHWVLVEPVTQPAAGLYDLRLEYSDGGIPTWDAYPDAVRYEPPDRDFSQVAVLDRSGSMLDADKIESARVAGRYFAEAAFGDDEMAVVSFDTSPTDETGSGLLPVGANRATIATAITGVTPSGPGARTSIGTGLDLGATILSSGAAAANRWGMTLLSDGLENEAPFWSRPGTPPPVRPTIDALKASHPDFVINTLALGPDADQGLLQEIANHTGGVYYPVYLGSSLSIFNRLADAYHLTRDHIDGFVRVHSRGDTFIRTTVFVDSIAIPLGTRRIRFALNWDRAFGGQRTEAAGAGWLVPIQLQIQRPDGSVLTAGPDVAVTNNRTDAVITVSAPEPGTWLVTMGGARVDNVEALLVVTAETPQQAFGVLIPGLSVDGAPAARLLVAAVDGRGFVRQASVTATLIGPDRQSATIQLVDDGSAGDGAARDGVFAATLPLPLAGSYLIHADFDLQTSVGPLRLSHAIGHYNRTVSDGDLDGIPDAWEGDHAPRCTAGLNPRGDPDGDGLDNATEWSFGSDPTLADTDGDGRDDGEEYRRGGNPRDPES